MRRGRWALGCAALAMAAGCVTATTAPAPVDLEAPQASDPYFEAAAAALASRVSQLAAEPPARNVILFVGDGMGVSTVTAARIFAGQVEGGDGVGHQLALDRFPHTALSRTYSHDFQVSDSAATATAMVAGVKTRSGVVGVTSGVGRGDCAAAKSGAATSLFELAEAAGFATGVVSTARVTHATPAAAYAHSADRGWESEAGGDCADIARQLVEWPAGDGLELALGGGR
ncbi:MAG: alkaline phosphatase, partial [Caulobacterales bacterium]|nr:alkaline phosphatase [Caulobacterales bacterium]